MANNNPADARSAVDMTPEGWFRLLFENANGVVNVFTHQDNRKLSYWVEDAETFANLLTEFSERNVWFGCCTRREALGPFQRGTKRDCVDVVGLWVDVDIKGPAHEATDLPETMDDALVLVDDFPLEPSIIVDTGNGLHAYWLFDEPRRVDEVEELLEVRWKATWKEHAQRRGWRIDNVFDVARVLRVPETFNHKSDPPKPVKVMRLSDRRYTPDELDEYTIELPDDAPIVRTLYEGPERPGDKYNACTDAGDLLVAHACVLNHKTVNGDRHYRAPHHANEPGTTGITVYADGHTTIYSETFANEHRMETKRPYDAFGLFTHLEHGGDFTAATEALRNQGFGDDHPTWGEIEDIAVASNVVPFPGTDVSMPPKLVTLESVAGIKLRRVRWVWDGRIPQGGLTLLAGREGEGKSTVAIDIMARLTRGTLEGEYYGEPKDVVIVATEDSFEYTIAPRLVAANADLDRVFRVVMVDATTMTLTLPVHLPALEAACNERDVVLIVMDPLLSRLSGNLDTHKDADVRQALEPLVEFTEEIRAATLGLIHLNKTATTDPLNAIMASKAFAAVARSVVFAMVDPDDESRHLLGLPKSNLGPTDLPTLTYTFEPLVVGEDDGPIIATRIVWGENVTVSIRDALEASTYERGALDEAVEWLRDYLTREGGSAVASVALRAGKQAGHSERTLRRAREKLGIDSTPKGFPAVPVWSWSGLDRVVDLSEAKEPTS
jgi:hypothetical protein